MCHKNLEHSTYQHYSFEFDGNFYNSIVAVVFAVVKKCVDERSITFEKLKKNFSDSWTENFPNIAEEYG